MIQEQEYQKIIHNQNAMYTLYARRIGVLDEEAAQMAPFWSDPAFPFGFSSFSFLSFFISP